MTVPIFSAALYCVGFRYRDIAWPRFIRAASWMAVVPLLALTLIDAPPSETPLYWATTSLALLIYGTIRNQHDFRLQSYATALSTLILAAATVIWPVHLLVSVPVVGIFYAGRFIARAERDRYARLFFSLSATVLLTGVISSWVSGGMQTVAWGVEGLILLSVCFLLRDRAFRLEGLTLLFVCTLKLFLYDLPNLETRYRILSFIALGVILLSVSWIYSRFREQIRKMIQAILEKENQRCYRICRCRVLRCERLMRGMMNRLFAGLLLVSSGLWAVAAAAQEGPVRLVLQQWLSAFNSGDAAKMSAFWEKYGGATGESHLEHDQQLRQMTGGMEIVKSIEDDGAHIVVLMREARGSYSELTLDLASKDPPVVRGIFGHPVPAPGETGAPAANDDDLRKRVDAHVVAMPKSEAFSGAILIAHDGEVVVDEAWGLANEEKRVKNTTDTQFSIGSMNKMFTAVAILQLAEQGKLRLDDPLVRYLPDYPNRDLANRVTVRELLSHTGGTGDIFTPEFAAHREKTRTLSDYVKLFGNREVRFEPGTRMEYSNYGFILLGRIIEAISGETYDQYVRKHVYAPAGMTHTDSRPESDLVEGWAIGYTRGPQGLEPNTETLPWSGTSAGGGYSTVGDLFRFAEALQGGKLLGAALLEEATTRGAVHREYGLGFYALRGGGYGHGGGAPGINGELRILPGSGYVLVALANRDSNVATGAVDFMEGILPVTELTRTSRER